MVLGELLAFKKDELGDKIKARKQEAKRQKISDMIAAVCRIFGVVRNAGGNWWIKEVGDVEFWWNGRDFTQVRIGSVWVFIASENDMQAYRNENLWLPQLMELYALAQNPEGVKERERQRRQAEDFGISV